MTAPGPRIFLSAGEPSGDLHAAPVIRALLARYPDAVIEAFGGPAMAEAGVTICYAMERYTAGGLVEIDKNAGLRGRRLEHPRYEVRVEFGQGDGHEAL